MITQTHDIGKCFSFTNFIGHEPENPVVLTWLKFWNISLCLSRVSTRAISILRLLKFAEGTPFLPT